MALKRQASQQLESGRRPVSAIQDARDFAVVNSSIQAVAGDSHTHHHYHSTNRDLQSMLATILNFRKIQQDTLAKATPGTITWLLECDEFRLFIDVDGVLKILWGSGMPGAGKTILASIVIATLEALAKASNGDICVGYVYIRYSDQAQVTLRSILETLVKQTVERHEDCMTLCEEAYHQHLREGTRPTEEELVALLRLFNSKRKLTFYVLDALDEAPTKLQLKLVRTLSSLGARLFITSRPLPSLEAKFLAAHTFEIRAQDQDLDLHIAQKISESHELQDLLDDSEADLRERLVSTVKEKCGGMFLHATLQLDALQGCFNVHDALKTLQAFPSEIEDVYQETWKRVNHADSRHQKSLAITAFAWVLYAKQSLTIEELRWALATCPQTHHYDPTRLMPATTIFAACRGLIVADRQSKLVRLVHYTAKKPLDTLLLQELSHPHSLLSAVCSTRLADCGFQHGASITWVDALDIILNSDPLLKYAYGAWAFHVSQTISVVETTRSLATSFIAGCSAFPIKPPLSLKEPRTWRSLDFLTPLHMVAFYDLPIDLAGSDAIQDPNVLTSGSRRTPLHFACANGCEALAKRLLSIPGVLVNLQDCDGYTPLIIACNAGHENVVKLLTARPDLDVNTAIRPFFDRIQTALTLASSRGSANIVQLLLAHPNVNANSGNPNALLSALPSGHHIIAKLLLEVPGINVHQVGFRNMTAIQLAAEHGYEDIVRRLLEFPGIRIDVKPQWGGTAMSEAQKYGHWGIVKLLQDFEAGTAAAQHREG